MQITEIPMTGIPQIDREHLELIKAFNEMVLRYYPLNCDTFFHLDYIVDLLQEHFSSEEKYMSIISFLELDDHKKEHQKLIQDAKHICQIGSKISLEGLVGIIKKQITEHIENWDKKLVGERPPC